MKLTISSFIGANKALHPKDLPDTAGVNSLNQKPGRADFRPWRVPLTVATVPASRLSIYRFGRDVRSDSLYWFSWPTRVRAVRGYNSSDTTERTFFTGDGAPKWTDNTLLGAGPTYPATFNPLGVPAPVSALVITPTGGTSSNNHSRYYTYTYVNAKGDESAPGPVSTETICKTDATATLGSVAAPPGGYSIDRIRFYRTATGVKGETEFFFLRETVYSVSSTTDDLRVLGAVLATDGWLVPPTNLAFLTAMWNGMIAGISGKGVRVCAAYSPYAWPIAYEFVPPDATPVALGRWQQNLLVLTTAKPAIITGTSPNSLDLAPLEGQSCSSAEGVVSFPHGVAWPCEDGLAYFGNAGAKLLTAGLLTRDDWQAMNPATMVGGIYEGAYLGFYDDASAVRRGFLIDPLNPQGIFFLSTGYSGLFFDELVDALFVLSGTNVQKWDAGASAMTATYRSKEYVTPPASFGWFKVTADAYPVVVKVDAKVTLGAGLTAAAASAAVAASNPGAITDLGAGRVQLALSAADDQAARLAGGFAAHEWQVQVETTQAVQRVVLATSVKETV